MGPCNSLSTDPTAAIAMALHSSDIEQVTVQWGFFSFILFCWCHTD